MKSVSPETIAGCTEGTTLRSPETDDHEVGKTAAPQTECSTFDEVLEGFSQSVDALRETCTSLDQRCDRLDWALKESNRRLSESLEERQRLASHLDSILRCLSVGVVAVDRSGRIIEFNDAAQQITGYDKASVLGSHYSLTVGVGTSRRLGLLHTVETGEALADEERHLLTASHERLPVRFSTSLIRHGNGEIGGAVEVFEDVRKAKLVEEELLRNRAATAVGEAAAELARQIRNPLAGVAGFAELLLTDSETDNTQRELVKKIQQGVSAIEQATTRFLATSELRSEQFTSVDFLRVLDRELDLFEYGLDQEAEIRLVRKGCIAPAIIRADEGQIRQVLRNVLTNSLEASQAGGVITVEICRERSGKDSVTREEPGKSHLGRLEDTLVVVIADCGEGMSSETLKSACSPFFSTRERRVGLGLTTVQRIMTSHGGSITLESSPGQGTRAIIRFPLADGGEVRRGIR